MNDLDIYLQEINTQNPIKVAELVYDTLMQNIQYPQLDLDRVIEPEYDMTTGLIKFTYNGIEYDLTLRKLDLDTDLQKDLQSEKS